MQSYVYTDFITVFIFVAVCDCIHHKMFQSSTFSVDFDGK